ncbi:hypothetical protein BC826DRAFT_613985 [Russula brevipes]|nr:hypothetical protein BC826DRAFT_613985 [Russula brevipes]
MPGTFHSPCNAYSSMHHYCMPSSMAHPVPMVTRRIFAVPKLFEAVSHTINESRRRREIVKEVLAAGKPAELLKKEGLGIVGRVRGGVTTPRSISRTASEEAERVTQIEHDIARTDKFIQRFAKETLEWVKSVQTLVCTSSVGR